MSKVDGRDHLLLDLLIADGPFLDALDDLVVVELPEGPLAVVSRATLVRMKRFAGRAQDLADLERLEAGREP